jgi:hypothetical protein
MNVEVFDLENRNLFELVNSKGEVEFTGTEAECLDKQSQKSCIYQPGVKIDIGTIRKKQ